MKTNPLQNIADTLLKMDKKAALFLADQNYEEALNAYEEILKAQEQLKLEKLCGQTLLNIANIYMVLNDYDKAFECINKAASLKTMQTNNNDRGNLKLCYANCLFKLGKAKEAESELKKELVKNYSKTLYGKMELMLFSYYMETNNKAAARTYADKAINHFKLDQNTNELLRALHARVDYFKSVGQAHYARYDEIEIERLTNS